MGGGLPARSNERRAAQRTQSCAAHEARKARGVERVAAPRGARVFARRVRVKAYTTLVRRTRPLRRDSSAPRDLVRSPSRFRFVLLFIRDAHNQHRPKKHRTRRPLVHLFFWEGLSFLLNSTGLGFSLSLFLFFFFFLFFLFVAFAFFLFSFYFIYFRRLRFSFFVAFAFLFFWIRANALTSYLSRQRASRCLGPRQTQTTDAFAHQPSAQTG